MFWVPEYYNTLDSIVQTKTVHFFNAPLPPGITSGKDWFQHSKGVYSEKHNYVWSRVTERHAGVEPTCCWFWIKKTKRGTPQIHRPRCYYITRKFFMQAEKSRSGASSFFPVENILIHTVFNAKGWNKRLMLLYHAALFHANRKPPTSATIDGSLRKDFRINLTSTPKRYENKIRNHYCYAITICFWLWSKSSKAACELALTTMDWFLSLHHQEMPPRLLWIWIIEYLYPNHYVNILPRRNNSRKQKAPCDKHDAFRNSFFTWKTSSRQNAARHCR